MQRELHFPNGFGASVINHGYGGEQGLFEVAVLHGDAIDYDTPIAPGGVVGWLDPAGVIRVCSEIAALPPRQGVLETR